MLLRLAHVAMRVDRVRNKGTCHMRREFFLLIAATCFLAACSSQSDDNSQPPTPSTEDQQSTAAQTGADKHLRVLVSYENGQFKLEKVTEVARPLRSARGRQTRKGINYVARGATTFLGAAPDPRLLHVEAPNPETGVLEHSETAAPGKQHFVVYVPADTNVVDFVDQLPEPSPAFRTSQATPSQPPTLGSIDLRGRR
jgi:hypothetical protein